MTIAFSLWVVRLCLGVTVAQTQPDPHDHSHHGVPVEFKMPKTYADAVAEIENRMHIIQELMDTKRLDQIHGQADVIRKAAKVCGILALNKDSGVPRTELEAVTRASRQLVMYFDKIDQPADAGNMEGTADAYEEMKKLVAVLSKYVPKLYACPMRCEKDKVSKLVEKCSVCGMDYAELKAHADHSPKHGGTFFMASDNKHHLEGVMTADRQFRIYFYDEYTVPISAAAFSAEATAWSPQLADPSERKLQITVGEDSVFLVANLDAVLTYPIRVKAFVNIPSMEKPHVFDFEFVSPATGQTETLTPGNAAKHSAPESSTTP